MPITPFHFGAGAALHAAAPRHVSFIAFCAVNCIIDLETIANVLRGSFPLHRFLHTFVGATLAGIVTVAWFLAMRAWAARQKLPNTGGWQQLLVTPVASGAFLGGSTHVIFDGIMHPDVQPFAPWSVENPFYRAIPLDALHWALFIAGTVGVIVTLLWRTQ